MSESLAKCEAEAEERISILRAEWNDERQDMTAMLQKEAQKILSVGSELKKLKANEITLDNQVSELTLQLETERHANTTLQSELVKMDNERHFALSQKLKFESQLEIAVEKIDQIGLSLQKAEGARDNFFEEKKSLNTKLGIQERNFKTISDKKVQLEEKYTGLVQKVGTLSAQLSSEQHNTAELHQSLQTSTENLSSTHEQLITIKEDFSRNKDELEKLQAEFAKARGDFEEERRKLSEQQTASLARMDELMQEMAYTKLHPFRTFFINLFEVTMSWAKSVFGCFGRLRIRKGLPTIEENTKFLEATV